LGGIEIKVGKKEKRGSVVEGAGLPYLPAVVLGHVFVV